MALAEKWLERVGLSEAADRKVRGFSVGMMQRLGVAAALISKPELIILDEPTSGMDPPGIQEMRALIRSLADHDGVTRHEPAWMKFLRCPMQSLFFPPVQLSNHGLQHHVQRPRQLFLRQSPKGQTAYWRTKSIRFA